MSFVPRSADSRSVLAQRRPAPFLRNPNIPPDGIFRERELWTGGSFVGSGALDLCTDSITRAY